MPEDLEVEWSGEGDIDICDGMQEPFAVKHQIQVDGAYAHIESQCDVRLYQIDE